MNALVRRGLRLTLTNPSISSVCLSGLRWLKDDEDDEDDEDGLCHTLKIK